MSTSAKPQFVLTFHEQNSGDEQRLEVTTRSVPSIPYFSSTRMIADNSRGSANAVMLDALRKAGDAGVHMNELVQICQETEYNTRKDIIPRLVDLRNRGLAAQVPGEDKWKISTLPSTGPVTQPTTSSIIDSSALVSNGKAVHPTIMSAVPKIYLPGMDKFSSYKNSLQEYCQKLQLPVPKYKMTRISTGILGSVSFSTNVVQAKVACDNSKEADQRAAYQALMDLGYLPEDATFDACPTLKRKDVEMSDANAPPSKIFCTGVSTFKSELNQMSQKNRLPMPQYSTVTINGGFFSTVTFNGRQFKSLSVLPRKKEAEQSAAEAALRAINGMESETDKQFPPDVADMITKLREETSSTTATTNTTGIQSFKNRLQEYCQRLKKPLPEYETVLNADKTFTTIVTVEGRTYTGQALSQKKAAERAAAENALKALGLMPE